MNLYLLQHPLVIYAYDKEYALKNKAGVQSGFVAIPYKIMTGYDGMDKVFQFFSKTSIGSNLIPETDPLVVSNPNPIDIDRMGSSPFIEVNKWSEPRALIKIILEERIIIG